MAQNVAAPDAQSRTTKEEDDPPDNKELPPQSEALFQTLIEVPTTVDEATVGHVDSIMTTLGRTTTTYNIGEETTDDIVNLGINNNDNNSNGIINEKKRVLQRLGSNAESTDGGSTNDCGQFADTMEESAAKRQRIAAKKVNNEQWDAMFERLQLYKQKYGHCLVPKRFSEDPKLGTWVETQRVQYKRLVREVDHSSGVEAVQPNKRLNQDRLRKLESIGFAWTAKGRKNEKNGRPNAAPLPSPTVTAPANTPALSAVPVAVPPAEQLVDRPKKPSPEEARNMARSRLNETQWEEMYQRLIRYKEKHGDTLVPRKYEEDPKLATWVETQRVLWNRDYREGSEQLKPGTLGWGGSATGRSDTASCDSSSFGSEKNLALTDSTHGTSIEQDPFAMQIENGHDQLGATGISLTEAAIAAASAAASAADDAMDTDAKLGASIQPRRLTKERKEKLDAIGFVWSLRSKRIDDHWDEMFRQLMEYKEKHGDCLVPSRYEQNLKLGKWVETQRYEYTKLQRNNIDGIPTSASVDPKPEADSQNTGKARATNPRLTEERLRRLESIGFEWKVKNKMKRYYDKQWDQMFDRLLKYKAETGHCMVPKRYPPDMKLGTWVHTQRIQYRKMMAGNKPFSDTTELGADYGIKAEDEVTYRLTHARRKRLEEIGFVWSAREGEKADPGRVARNSYDDQWDAMFMRLRNFKERYGHCLVPKRYKDDPKLGTWVDTQRVQFKKMKKKIAAGETESSSQPKVERQEPEVQNQSSSAASKPVVGRLTDERIGRLEALGFVWSLRDDWQKHYEELREYKREHGHCNVPARYTKNRRLGIWVSAQRQQYKIMQSSGSSGDEGVNLKQRRSAPLTQERINLLNNLGFTWTIRSRDPFGEGWNPRMDEYRNLKSSDNYAMGEGYSTNPEYAMWLSHHPQYVQTGNEMESCQPRDDLKDSEGFYANGKDLSYSQMLANTDESSALMAEALVEEAMQAADEAMRQENDGELEVSGDNGLTTANSDVNVQFGAREFTVHKHPSMVERAEV